MRIETTEILVLDLETYIILLGDRKLLLNAYVCSTCRVLNILASNSTESGPKSRIVLTPSLVFSKE